MVDVACDPAEGSSPAMFAVEARPIASVCSGGYCPGQSCPSGTVADRRGKQQTCPVEGRGLLDGDRLRFSLKGVQFPPDRGSRPLEPGKDPKAVFGSASKLGTTKGSTDRWP